MRMIGDLAQGGHQAHWVEMFEVSIIRSPWYLRLGRRVKDFFCPRPAREWPGRILPGQPIQKIGTGYHDPTLPGGPTHATRQDSGRRVYYA